MVVMKNASWQSPPPPPGVRWDFYRKIRFQIRTWAKSQGATTHRYAELVLMAPDLFHLACRLVTDPRVPAREKAKLGLVIAYFVSPFDLLPEAILGPIGYADDVALTAMVLHGLVNSVGEDVLREHWAGEEPVLTLLQRVLALVDARMGAGLVRRLRSILER
jgi:uncharacterized membrane protein YkvA (DUF1232 family)